MIYEILIYNLKVSLCMVFLYAGYALISRSSTLHALNKGVLLALVAFSFIIPLFNFYTVEQSVELPQIVSSSISAVSSMASSALVSWDLIAGLIFLAGILVSTLRYAVSIISTVRIIRQSEHYPINSDITVCVTDSDIIPFNWFRYIVLSKNDYLSGNDEVLVHEKAHLQLYHTLEFMIVRVIAIIQWYNPIMRLILRDIRSIHEYQADEKVINTGFDAKKYQLLLIDRVSNRRCISCTNNFGQITLKKRIIMMLKKPTTKWRYLRLLYIVPAVALAMISLSVISCSTTKNAQESQPKAGVIHVKNNPCIFLNGKEITNEEMQKIDPQTIDHINVLKDESVIAKYGDKAKDGAIEITLK